MEEEQAATSSTDALIPTPKVTIPDDFSIVRDSIRGYSLAIPSGWQEIDLRGKQVSNIASMIGQAEAVEQLQKFLATEQGQSIGILAATDLTSMVWGGFPTLLNVSILDASNSDAESIVDFVQEQLEANSQRLGDFDVQEVVPTTINNLPAVTGTGAVDLSNFGRDVKLFVETVALLANDKVYMLTLATPTDKVDDYETMFDQIIGTFRPE